MATFTIKHLVTGATIYKGEAETLAELASLAVKEKADLRGADLRGANLRSADLRKADLRSANLRWANLRGANLRWAELSSAELRRADLRGADLRGAVLRGADLIDADLESAFFDWQSHDLVAEVLRRAAQGDIEKLKVAGLIAIQRDWCWGDFLTVCDPLKAWAVDALAAHVLLGDGAPAVLRKAAEAKATADTLPAGTPSPA